MSLDGNQTSPRPRTVGDLNCQLVSLGFRPSTKQQLDQILEIEPRERLLKALSRAAEEDGAMAYLERFFEKNFREAEPNSPNSPEPVGYVLQRLRPQWQNPNMQVGNQKANKHVYGSKGALCFEPDETRAGVHTICMDAADSTGPKQYNWGGKIRLQLTRDELLMVTADLFGFLPKCEGKNHGEDNSKGFSLEDQGDKLFMRVFAKGRNIKAVPIFPEDAFYVAQLFLGQMKKNASWLSANEILLTLQRVHASRRGTSGAPPNRQTH